VAVLTEVVGQKPEDLSVEGRTVAKGSRLLAQGSGFEGEECAFEREECAFESQERVFEREERVFESEECVFESEERVFESEECVFESQECVFESQECVFEGEERVFESQECAFESQECAFEGVEVVFESQECVFEGVEAGPVALEQGFEAFEPGSHALEVEVVAVEVEVVALEVEVVAVEVEVVVVEVEVVALEVEVVAVEVEVVAVEVEVVAVEDARLPRGAPFATVTRMPAANAKVSRIDRLVPWLGGLALAVPVVATRYPPMSDLPLHEGMVALLVHHADATWAPPGLYALNLGHANQLFYLLAYPLALLVATDLACKLVVAAIVVLTLGAAGRLAAHLGRSPWAALTLAPVVVGWTFFWGFVANLLGFALFLLALPLVDRAEAKGARGAGLACALAVLVFLAHEASALALSGAIVVFALSEPLHRRTLVRLAPVAVMGALSVVEIVRDHAIETPLAKLFAQQVLWHPLATKLSSVPRLLTGAHGLWTDLALLAPALGLAVLGVVVRARGREEPPRARRYAVLAGVLLLAYLAAPYSVNFGAYLYVRFLAPAFAVAVLAAAPSKLHVAARLAAVAVPLATLSVAMPQFAAASDDHRQLDTLTAQIDRASAVDVLHVGKRDKTLLFEATGAGNRVLAERGGRLAFSFTEYPIAPVVIAPAYQWNDTGFRLYADPTSLRPGFDLDRFRYVLVHARDAELAKLVERAIAPDARVVAVSGEWTLFESTHTMLPLTAADAPLPPDPPATLQERVHTVVRDSALTGPASP